LVFAENQIMIDKIVYIILEFLGWLQILLCPTLIAGVIALVVYLKWQDQTGKIAALSILVIGFMSGIILATSIWKKYGTIEWLSKISESSKKIN
jgi:hypothetical protein